MEPNLTVTMTAVTGTASQQIIAIPDSNRRYLACYAKTGTSFISYGDSNHTTTAIELAEGDYQTIPSCSQVKFTGNGSVIVVIHDDNSDSPTPVEDELYYNGNILTYNGLPLEYII